MDRERLVVSISTVWTLTMFAGAAGAQGPGPQLPPLPAGADCNAFVSQLPAPESSGDVSVTIGTTIRWVRIRNGSTPATAHPLLFAWHGTSDPATYVLPPDAATQSVADWAFSYVTTDPTWTVVAPYANPINISPTRYPFFKSNDTLPDLLNDEDNLVADAALVCLSGQQSIQLDRIYAIGYSAGAWQASAMAANRNQYLAGTILLSGNLGYVVNMTYDPNVIGPSDPSRRIAPAIMFNGSLRTSDPLEVPSVPSDQNFQRSLMVNESVPSFVGYICAGPWGHRPPGDFSPAVQSKFDVYAISWLSTHPYNAPSDTNGAILPTGTFCQQQ